MTADCAVCGAASPGVTPTADRDPEASFGGVDPNGLRVAFAPAGGPAVDRTCAACGTRVGPEAKFCRGCGAPAGPGDRPRPEASLESVALLPQAVALRGADRPRRHIVLDDLDGAFADDLPPPPSNCDMDYLDALIGQMAPGSDPAPPKPPGRGWGRRDYAPEPVAEPSAEPVAEPAARPEAPAAARTPTPPVAGPAARAPRATSALAEWATGLAFVALGFALLTHVVAPTAVPGYTAGEIEIKVHVQAIEWLLAGTLVALIGLLARR